MRIVRVRDGNGSIHRGILDDESVRVTDDAGGESGLVLALDTVTLLAPVAPSKIIGIGRNYRAHAEELGNEVPEAPLIFLKPPSSIINPGETIVRPPESSRVDYEGELAVVIGRRCRSVAASDWRSVVLGFTVANDVTARDLQKKDVQFTRGKGFDTFCPIGPWIETEVEAEDLELTTRLNGEVVQSGRTSQMIFACDRLIEYVTTVMTLEPGDVILTGTPEGVGPLSAGDRVAVEIEGIGVLESTVNE